MGHITWTRGWVEGNKSHHPWVRMSPQKTEGLQSSASTPYQWGHDFQQLFKLEKEFLGQSGLLCQPGFQTTILQPYLWAFFVFV